MLKFHLSQILRNSSLRKLDSETQISFKLDWRNSSSTQVGLETLWSRLAQIFAGNAGCQIRIGLFCLQFRDVKLNVRIAQTKCVILSDTVLLGLVLCFALKQLQLYAEIALCYWNHLLLFCA